MRKILKIFILLILPIQAFCDSYWVSNRQNINTDIQTIEKGGGIIKDVKTTRINDYDVSYTIVYRSEADIKAEIDIMDYVFKKNQ